MTDRRFIGPNGARFTWTEPLPGWLTSRLASGEIQEDTRETRPTVGKKKKTTAAR